MSISENMRGAILMMLSMGIPNIIGVVLLSGEVRRDLYEYWQKLRSGEMKVYK